MSLRKAANRWRPDEEVSSCARCQTKFTLFTRRHHCRQCGDVFCKQCSSKKRIVPIVHQTEPQRVCERCYHMGRGAPATAAASSPAMGSSQPQGGVSGGAVASPAPTPMVLSSPQPHPAVAGTSGGGGTTVSSSAAGSRRPSSLANNTNSTPTLPPPHSNNNSVVGLPGAPPAPSYYSRGTSPTNGGSQSPQVQFDQQDSNSNSNSNSNANPQSGRSAGTNGGPYIATVRTIPSPEAGAYPLGPNGIPTGPDGEAIILGDNFAESSDEEETGGGGYGYYGNGEYGQDNEEDSDRETPPSMKPVIVSENTHFSENANNTSAVGGALSFMAALEDATRTRQHSLPVLLYVMQGQEMPIVAAVESADELCEDMIARLTPKWWELKYGLRKRPKGDDLELLKENLQFVNESGNPIPKDIPVSDLCRRQERVILSTLDTVVQQKKSTHSTRSLEVQSGFFMRSERSEESEDDGLMMY